MPSPAALEIIERIADLEALRDEWSALCDGCPDVTPFQRPEWLLPWCHMVGRNPLRVVSLRQEGRLVALVPLELCSERASGDAATGGTLRLIGAPMSDYLDAIVDPACDRAALLPRMVDIAGVDALDLEQLRAGSPLLTAPPPAGFLDESGPQAVCPFVPLPHRLDLLPSLLGKRLAESLPQYRRRLARLGEVRFEAVTGDNLDLHLDALLRLHAAHWQTRGQPGVLSGAALPDFHREAARGFLARGTLVLDALRIGGHIAGVIYGLRDARRVYLYLSGYDPSLSRLSIGTVLIAHAFEAAVARGCETLDFLRGAEPYKYRFGARDAVNHRRRLVRRHGQ